MGSKLVLDWVWTTCIQINPRLQFGADAPALGAILSDECDNSSIYLPNKYENILIIKTKMTLPIHVRPTQFFFSCTPCQWHFVFVLSFNIIDVNKLMNPVILGVTGDVNRDS